MNFPDGALGFRAIDPSLYENLVESAPDAVVLIDSNGRILLVNRQTESLFGYSRAQMLGQPVEILVPERYRTRHTIHRDAYFAEPKVRGMGAGVELSGLRRDGTEFPLEISLSPLRTASGIYATASVRDISDRKRTQQQFRALLESAPDAMVIINQHGEIMLVNAQTERMFGFRREALVGKKVEVLIPERLRGRHLADRDGYFRNPKVREMGAGLELSGRRKDGTEFPIEISLSPLETENGTWATAAVRDVTEAKRERDAAVRLAAIVESSNDAIIGKDLEGRITSWNRGAELLYGYAAAEMMGESVTALFPPESLHEEEDILARVRRGEQIKHFETQRLIKDGSRIEVSLTISPICDAQGRVIGASTIARDIGERRRADERFRALLETAPEAMVIIDRAGRIVLINAQTERVFGYPRAEIIGQSVEILVPAGLRESHAHHRTGYFESPKVRHMGVGLELLRNVVSFAQLLAREVRPAAGSALEEYLGYIVGSGLHMQALIQDLLAYSHAGREDEAPEAVRCDEALQQVLESFRAVIQERNATITCTELPTVMASMRELMQVLQNLIGNAIKFQPGPGPRVHISAQREGPRWRIAVRDQGIGIKKEHYDRIFQIFQRLHSPEDFDGTGIGLALCQKIVKHRGGSIRVESEPGKGSTFSFTLLAAP